MANETILTQCPLSNSNNKRVAAAATAATTAATAAIQFIIIENAFFAHLCTSTKQYVRDEATTNIHFSHSIGNFARRRADRKQNKKSSERKNTARHSLHSEVDKTEQTLILITP